MNVPVYKSEHFGIWTLMDAHVCLYNNVCEYNCRHLDIYLFIPSSPKSIQTERPSLKEVEKLERRARGREEMTEEEGEERKS